MTWTGLDFGDAWPYLAAGYGLFFAALGLGFALIYLQAKRVKADEQMLATLTQDRSRV